MRHSSGCATVRSPLFACCPPRSHTHSRARDSTNRFFVRHFDPPATCRQAGRQAGRHRRERQREMGFFCVVAGRGPVAAEQQSETEFLVPSTDLLSVSYVCRRAFLARSWTSRGTPRHLVLTSTHRRLCVCRSFCVFIDGVMPVVRVARRVAREHQAPPNVDNVSFALRRLVSVWLCVTFRAWVPACTHWARSSYCWECSHLTCRRSSSTSTAPSTLACNRSPSELYDTHTLARTHTLVEDPPPRFISIYYARTRTREILS